MRHKRINRRAEEDESGHVLIGLVLLAIILVTIAIITMRYGKEIVSFLGNTVKNDLLKLVNADSLYTRASEANFGRLNDEISSLLENPPKTDHVLVPYTLGQYRLVGFNKDKLNGINRDCLSDKLVALRPDKCKNAACLCLCYIEESCECVAYGDVDYIITTKGQFRNYPKKEGTLVDSVADEEASCLMVQGAYNEKETLGKVVELSYDNWWRSNTVYLEKTEKDGKRYLFFSRYQDIKYTGRMYADCNIQDIKRENCVDVASCADYKAAELGCEWEYTCQNNVCPNADQGCNVVDNPYATTDADSSFCLAEDESIEDFCTADTTGASADSAGRKGDLFWQESRGLCFRCIGLGMANTDSWGWSQESAIDKGNCINS